MAREMEKEKALKIIKAMCDEQEIRAKNKSNPAWERKAHKENKIALAWALKKCGEERALVEIKDLKQQLEEQTMLKQGERELKEGYRNGNILLSETVEILKGMILEAAKELHYETGTEDFQEEKVKAQIEEELAKRLEQKERNAWAASHHVPIVGEGGKETPPGFIKDGICKKSPEEICYLGYACDACPFLEENVKREKK